MQRSVSSKFRGADSESIQEECMRIIQFFLMSAVLTVPSVPAYAQDSKPKAPGKIVDVGGYKLYLDCRGQGSPTVVLESGLDDSSAAWGAVQPEVAKFTRVCSYDRAYIGFSDAGPIPWTLHQQVFDLHQLLKAANIQGPYVLVGQSLGGLLNQVYKSLYSADVAGMILVDSTSVDSKMGDKPLRSAAKGAPVPPAQTMASGPPPPLTPEEQASFDKALPRLAKEVEGTLPHPYDKLPAEAQAVWRWEHSHPKMHPGSNNPMLTYWAEEMELMHREREGKEHIYGDMPLYVLAAARASSDADRLREVNDMAHMSTNSLLLLDPKSDHDMHIDVPSVVIQSILQVVEAVHAGIRLDAPKPGGLQ
jgi:pimeloyl-ACP methyl ester carboxylesterase